MDLTEEYESTPSITMLNNAAAAYVNQSAVGLPSENLKVSFVNLADTAEYADIAPLETVKLCDIVTVIYPDLGVRAAKKVIRTVWDVLQERYLEIELGDTKSSLGETIKGAVNDELTGIIRQTHKIVSVVTAIDTEVGEIRSQVSELEETADNLTESIANLNIRANEIVSMVSETRTELIDGYTSAIDEFGNQIANTYATKSELSQTASQISATITEVSNTVDELGNEVSTTQQAVASLSIDGLTVNTGGQSSSRIDSDGLKVIGSDGQVIAEFTNQNSAVDYLKVRTHLSFGAHRAEAATDTEHDNTSRVGTAFFWTGDVV
jgi:methyl-accepting chemotaxis protein